MPFLRSCGALLRRTACVATLVGATILPAQANQFDLIYTGAFSAADSLALQGGSNQSFSAGTPFTAIARFDDSSPNIAAPVGISGFVAYSPLSATLTVNGQTYNLTTYNQNPTSGVTVSIFDNTTPFGITPTGNHYGVGLLANPLEDGAGFIGDWGSAAPNFSAAHLTPTEFTDYFGVGYGAGPGAMNANPTIVPIPLTDSLGQNWALTLGNYDEEAAVSPLNTARIIAAVPEPGSFALLASLGLTGAGFLIRRRK